MVKVKLQSGFEATIDPEQLNDMYFVEALAEMDTNLLVLPKVCTMLFGEEQKKALYKSLEGENGKVRLEDVGAAIVEIMTAAGEETKNS